MSKINDMFGGIHTPHNIFYDNGLVLYNVTWDRTNATQRLVTRIPGVQ